jgi:hypothetical protein
MPNAKSVKQTNITQRKGEKRSKEANARKRKQTHNNNIG